MKKISIVVLIAVLALSAGFVLAQGNKGSNAQNGKPDSAPSIPVVKDVFEVSGAVESVSLGIGQGSPSIIVNGMHLILGPYFYLENAGFECEEGDEVTALVFESLVYENTWVVVEIYNSNKETSIVLRDESGNPLWTRNGPKNNGGKGSCAGPAINLESAEILQGSISAINAELGQRNPTVLLGADQVVIVGPLHVWLDGEFELLVGDSVEILAFPSNSVPGTWVAVKIDNLTTGETLVLRDDTGVPIRYRAKNQTLCPLQ